MAAIESYLNSRYFQQVTDGTNILPPVEADVKTSELGRIVIFPPIQSSSNSPVGSSSQQMSIFSDGGFYYQCQLATGGVPSGQPVNVLKSYKLRTTLGGETIMGVPHSYEYPIIYTDNSNPGFPFNYYQRKDSFASSVVNQQVIPDAIRGDELWAQPCNLTLGGITFLWIDENRDGRNWTELPQV